MTEGFVADRPEFEWLTEKAGGWQFGEQGILVALANLINQPGQCVEVGAGDAEGLPLTIEPFYNYGLDCVLFEKDEDSIRQLAAKFPRAKIRGEYAFETSSNLDAHMMLCVIDVDGIDSLIMEHVLSNHQTSILMVEHFDKCHSSNTDDIGRVPAWLLGREIDSGFKIQDNAETVYSIACDFNYTRLGTTRVNSIFVHDSLVEKVTKHVPV
jgi:hypothetical protein